MKILVTGTAGFIGHHLALRLAQRGDEVIGIDNINDYYDVELKYGRLAEQGFAVETLRAGGAWDGSGEPAAQMQRSARHPNLRFLRMDLENGPGLKKLLATERCERVCNLAAQAGVRYSLTNPDAYIASNVQGFLNVLEAVRAHPVEHLVYASTSSVYGLNPTMPFQESHPADHPGTLYATSKRANELMAHNYSHLYGVPSTGLRFFTVYGPWGRPDMALFLFTKAILAAQPIQVFNKGNMSRDFTYVGDIVEGVMRVIDRAPQGAPDWDGTASDISPEPWRVYNIGNGAPVQLTEFIAAIEAELGTTALKEMLPMQPGDVPATWADCSALEREFGYRPGTDVRDGIRAFVQWYRSFYGV